MEALHVATIHILTRDGLARCTTTRVAERAGISIGSLYQYYPNRDALLAAVLEKHLSGVADAVERVGGQQRGKPVAEMASALVAAFLSVKLRNPEESRALYAISGDRGGPQLVADVQARMVASIAAMLASASDARYDDPVLTGTIVLTALAGPVKSLLEGHIRDAYEPTLERQLVRLVTAYLQADQARS